MSKTAELTFAYETTLKIADVKAAPRIPFHDIGDMAALDFLPDRFRTAGMIVAPCARSARCRNRDRRDFYVADTVGRWSPSRSGEGWC